MGGLPFAPVVGLVGYRQWWISRATKWQPKLASKNALVSRDPFLESPEKLFYVCSVCLQYQSFNNFENDTMKVSVNAAKLTGL